MYLVCDELKKIISEEEVERIEKSAEEDGDDCITFEVRNGDVAVRYYKNNSLSGATIHPLKV